MLSPNITIKKKNTMLDISTTQAPTRAMTIKDSNESTMFTRKKTLFEFSVPESEGVMRVIEVSDGDVSSDSELE